MQPRPLPPELLGSFHVREADRLGIPRRRLAARDVRSTFHGTYHADPGVAIESVTELCQAYLPRLVGGQFFSHVTAAALWGMPLSFATQRELHVGAVPPAREPRTRHVIGHRLVMPSDGVTLLRGMPLTTRVETWAQLGATLRIEDLVAAGDWCISQGDERANLEEVAVRARRRGAIALREACELVRAGSESPRESVVRTIMLRAGLPEPELNWTLRTSAGVFVARLDLAYPRRRVAVEYDGRQHADIEQFKRDADRWRAVSDEGWTLIRVLDHRLANPERDIIAPVRRALGAPPRP